MARKVEGPIWLLIVLVLVGGGIGLFAGLGMGGVVGAVTGAILGALAGFLVWYSDFLIPQKDA